MLSFSTSFLHPSTFREEPLKKERFRSFFSAYRSILICRRAAPETGALFRYSSEPACGINALAALITSSASLPEIGS